MSLLNNPTPLAREALECIVAAEDVHEAMLLLRLSNWSFSDRFVFRHGNVAIELIGHGRLEYVMNNFTWSTPITYSDIPRILAQDLVANRRSAP